MKQICKIHLTILMISTISLSSCARKDPVESIVDNQINHVNQVLDYAYNNIDQNSDVVLLESELDSCAITLDAVKQTHNSQIGKCEAEKDYWKLATFGLFVLLMAGILAKIKKII